ncbi:hypothetical protein A4R35_20230 [Thermogemmatispora tikiterensis]|uniref:Uncharacterized protein n=1 Tax=Thermogemmatispora tikiterensis TaxID=1825093 RepID=A0A328VKA2_9CHLR|nr:hypothetical protein A4R35_20230 [Thermogemmatispora tikiterensis]
MKGPFSPSADVLRCQVPEAVREHSREKARPALPASWCDPPAQATVATPLADMIPYEGMALSFAFLHFALRMRTTGVADDVFQARSLSGRCSLCQ